jgi:flagellar biosynthesis/type III secretory pathway M-ring protein FliF/YscJ
MKTIKKFFFPFLVLFAGIVAILKFFVAPKKEDVQFPGTEEKKKTEAEVEETKKEIEEVKDKTYSDEEIEKKFNG